MSLIMVTAFVKSSAVDGYQGLDPGAAPSQSPLHTNLSRKIFTREGGTVLSTSRGPVDINVAVDNLIRRKINILFVVGGDGT